LVLAVLASALCFGSFSARAELVCTSDIPLKYIVEAKAAAGAGYSEHARRLTNEALEMLCDGNLAAREKGSTQDFAEALEGSYVAEGKNPDGSLYQGRCVITKIGQNRYRFDWTIGSKEYTGTGTRKATTITVDWGATDPVIYTVKGDGTLVGTWAAGRASETLTRVNSKQAAPKKVSATAVQSQVTSLA
jgi:hypothetical protein